MPAHPECYSVRQLSPFIGNIQIVQADYCRALSSNGTHWQIQASCETHQQQWNIAEDEYVPRRYVLYGSWDKTAGFSSLPLDPMLDVPDLQYVQENIISTLEHSAADLPFPQQDGYECWLMLDQQPLALIASATQPQMIPHIHINKWQAVSQQDFSGNLLNEQLLAQIQQLEEYINQLTDSHEWFKRLADGTAQAVNNPQLQYDQHLFPDLLVNPQLLDKNHREHLTRLIDWQSPRLLTLQNLDKAQRQQLEVLAQHHAVETYRRRLLFPHPLDKNILTKIQVELKIRGL